MSIFTKILKKEIPADIIFENDNIFVIHDMNPKAKTHLLIIPKKEIPTINDLEQEDVHLIAEIFFVAQRVTKNLWIHEWYQLHFNVWEKWWQEVKHIHMHVLSDI